MFQVTVAFFNIQQRTYSFPDLVPKHNHENVNDASLVTAPVAVVLQEQILWGGGNKQNMSSLHYIK